MLPPKRSTRSVRTASHSVDVEANQATGREHNVKPARLPPLLPRPADVHDVNDNENFILSTPQHVEKRRAPTDSSQKRTRRKLTTPQRLALEDLASRDNNPSLQARRALAEELGLDFKVVSVWFQNKRRPTNKLNGSTQSDNPRGRGPRLILGDVNDNATPNGNPLQKSDLSSETESKTVSKASEEGKASFPGIWDYLPSSSPGPASEASQSESSQTERASEPVGFQKRHRSLEWACLNDKRATKKSKTGPNISEQELIIPPLSSVGAVLERRRQRTDKKPQNPIASVSKKPSIHTHGRLTCAKVPSGECFDDQSGVGKDVLDVALALIQLKGQRYAPAGRKSI